MGGFKTFEQTQKEVKNLQIEFNEKIKSVLANCEDDVCIRVMETYLSHVDPADGYPIQLNIWNDNIIPQKQFPVFGKGVKPL